MSIKRKRLSDYPLFQVSGPPPFSTIGLFTFLRTYARRHDEEDPKSTIESWQECIERVVNSCNSQLKVGFTEDETREVFNLLYNLKCSVAGRFMWQLGTRTVDKLGLPSLQNCSFVVVNEPIKPFTWTMNFLMLGSGVGYRILPEDVSNIPQVKYALITRKDTKDADYIVPDSREGWVKLLGKVLKAHFYSGQNFTYSCTLLRSKGAPIKSFGGLASGPEILCDGMEKISSVLNKRAGMNLRPVDALDIMNIIGYIVVSGNVRRSAQLAMGDCKDPEFLGAKDWSKGNIPNWRCYSNNSIVCNDINDILDNEEFWKGYEGNGEPYGLINLKLSKSCGRLGEFQYPDPNVDGYNPCFSAETLIAVADGRGAVPIKQLVEEDNDVPVYSMNPETHEVSIQWGRNPRVTGENQKLLRVYFNNPHVGQFVDVTPSHRFFTTDGRELTANQLKTGDSIPMFKKHHSEEGHFEIYNTQKPEHILVKEFYEFKLQNQNVNNNNYEETYKKSVMETKCEEAGLNTVRISDTLVKIIRQCEACKQEFLVKWSNRGQSYCSISCENKKLHTRLRNQNSYIHNNNYTVLRVEELQGTHTVYNITIEKNHTMAVVTKAEEKNLNLSGIYFFNCAEQSLNSFESCCLSELYLPNIKTKEELYICAKYMYRICKHSLLLPCADSKDTERVVHQNMRMGIGVTGYLQATEEQKSWLSDCYKFLRDFDKQYSVLHGFPMSVKLTTCKPSGTLSLLGGCTSGVHPGFAQYYRRRIRIASESPLLSVAKKHGYPVEYVKNFDGSIDHTTQIITFPYKLPMGTILAENCTAIEQLEWVKRLQTEWSDNSVSVTVYYRKNELPAIKEWLRKNYNNGVKTVSFLLHSEHGFLQAPLEAMTKEEYEELASQCKPITDLEGICYMEEKLENLDSGCASGACPLR